MSERLLWDLPEIVLASEAMLKRILVALLFCCPLAYAAETPASETSVKQLLEVGQTRKLLGTMTEQLENYMKVAMESATHGQPASPEVQKMFDQCRADVLKILKEEFSWDKLEPMYLRIYKESFSQQEVDGMITFYRSPSGQAVLNKMPVAMQNSMKEMQQMMGPLMERIKRMQQDMVAQVRAEKDKKPAGVD